MKLAGSNVARTALASAWNYSTRVLGLGWTALLIATLGIGDYGQYAIGIAGAAIINAGVDNAFYVRSLRVDEDEYLAERSARVLFATALAVIGVVCFTQWYVVGFAIIVAAGEQLFNTFKSQFLRLSRPDIAMRFDAIRQPASIGLAAGYVVLADNPHLDIATALYVAPYAVILAACLRYVPGHRPARPGGRREMFILSSEAFAAAIYVNGDLLVLGWLAGDTVTGYYSVALVTASAIASIGQNYANTFIERLRAVQGDLSAAPRPLNIVKVGLVTGGAMAVTGIGILIWGGADMVGGIFLVMSLWVAARAIEFNFVVILFAQRRDALRVRVTAGAAVVKAILVIPAVYFFGAYGAAVVGVLCEFALIGVYFHKIYRAGWSVDLPEPREGRQQ